VYENFMSYYWSGRRSYLELGCQYLDHLLTKGMYEYGIKTSHYGMEFFVRAFDMLDDSGHLSPEQVRRVDGAFLESFQGWPKREEQYLARIRAGAHHAVVSDHQSAAFMSEKTLCRFVLERLNVSDEAKRDASRRYQVPDRALDQFIISRWRGCGQGAPYTDVPTQAFFRHALETEQYAAFFDSGLARRAALYHLARCANPDGADIGLAWGGTRSLIDFKLFLGICASYYRDGGLKQVIETIPARIRPHYGVNVNGVHRYRPGDEVAAESSDTLIGASWVPLVPVHYQRLAGASAKPHTPTYERSFNVATIRGGFRSEDDYLLMKGAGPGGVMLGNVILRLTSKGQYWLTHTASASYFNQNALYVNRLSKWSTDDVMPSKLSRRNEVYSTDSAALLSATLPGYAGTDWRRDIVWLKGRFWIVFDTVTARSSDEYAVMANWRVGGGALAGDRWIVRRGDWEFVVAPCTRVESIADTDVGHDFRGTFRVLRQRRVCRLETGESLTIANLLFVRPLGSREDYAARLQPDGSVLVRASPSGKTVLVGAPAKRGDATNAPLVVLRRDQTTALGVTSPRPAAPDSVGRVAPQLKTCWRYTGAQKPGRIHGVSLVAPNTFDLGRSAGVAEVRTLFGELPEILISPDDRAGFRRLDGEVTHGCHIRMRNYGETVEREKSYQILKCARQQARRIKVASDDEWRSDQLIFYDADRPEARERMQVRVVDLDGDGDHEILVHPYVWPDTRGTSLLEHELYVLNSDGTERWKRKIKWRMHFARPLAWDTSGRRHIFVGSMDDYVYVFNPQGKLVRKLTLMGSENLRVYPCPSAIGTWQPDEKGKLKIILPRYHWTGFFNHAGEVEGHVNTLGYWTNNVLGRGADITGDGIEDTVLMHSTGVVLVDGVRRDEVRKPAHGPPLPMPYRISTLGLPAIHSKLGGSPTLAFQLIDRASPAPRHLLVARRNMVGLADLRAMKWIFRWVPLAPLTAFCMGSSHAAHCQFMCATRDGLLRVFNLSEKFEVLSTRARPTPGLVDKAIPLESGAYVLACDNGLYRFDPTAEPLALMPGSFVDVAESPSRTPGVPRLVVVDSDGVVECLRPNVSTSGARRARGR